MSDTNFIGAIVRILECPKNKITENNIEVTKFRAQCPQIWQTQIIEIVIWGSFANDIAKYYSFNDYILVEGYLSLSKSVQFESNKKIIKRVQFTILKVYPFLLSSN